MKNTSVGQFIRALRLQRGITQEILAGRADVAAASLSSIELDKHQAQEATAARILDVLRAHKEMTRSEQEFAKVRMRLPEDYSWEAPNVACMLSWDHIESNKAKGYSYWINHCVREMTLQLGQEAMLDTLLVTAKAKGLIIPENPSM